MSSFFTLPASQRKRKRTEGVTAPASKKRNVTQTKSTRPQKAVPSRPVRDESISGSESDEDGGPSGPIDAEEDGDSSEAENEDETAAERRLRLAERYLENLREEVDEVGFDAADIDRDIIAERLKEDVVCGSNAPHVDRTLAYS
jgi:ribosomal RNA-processing protein 9